MSNPGKTMSINDIPFILNQAQPNSIIPKNIIAGFKATGIWSFNKIIFGDKDFLPSDMTDHSQPWIYRWHK